ncbi:MAG: alpha/beta hydrolase [Candidatus Bathyarchaeia archaeon]
MPYAKINDIQMYYELHGAGETIVFLNGILANTSSWMNQVPYFAKQFQTLLLDFRGQGKSEKPLMKYPMELHVEDLRALMQKLKIQSAHIVGISFGGEVALIFATRYPEMVKSLIVSCAVSHVDPVVKAIVERWLIAARLRSGKYLFQAVYPDIFSDEFIEKRWDFVSGTAPIYDTAVDIDAFIELLKGFMQLNITPELYKIKKPTLIIAAENDKIKPPKYSKIIHNKIQGSRFVAIKNSGHAVIWERPEEFNNIALQFIKEQQ